MSIACPHDGAELSALREWAWERGRTDLVLALDLHERWWRFAAEPGQRTLVALAAIAPRTRALEPLQRLALAGASELELARLRTQLRDWVAGSCRAVDGALAEMHTADSVRG